MPDARAPDGDLKGIYVESGISARDGEPFCRVQVEAELAGGGLASFVGQLTPREVRACALGWLEAAEGAIHDAAVYRLLTRSIELDESQAAAFVRELRERRADADDMPDPPA